VGESLTTTALASPLFGGCLLTAYPGEILNGDEVLNGV
jgi:hypothetical protein